MVDFNVEPYYDDFDASKGFYRLLFRPGRPVQARELTQLQTSLQNQISNLSKHFFEDGSQVLPGSVAYDFKLAYVKVEAQYSSVDIDVENFVGKTIEGQTSGVTALVVAVSPIEGSDPNTLFVKYTNSGTDNETSVFQAGEILETTSGTGSFFATVQGSAATGFGSSAAITEGVYFIQGVLGVVNSQTIILEKYSVTPSYKVGLTIEESFVESADDTSLLDNATGAPNENAPGADRYKVELILDKKAITSTDDENFVELLRIEDGNIKKLVTRSDYSIFEETLARRTFDESGNYTVKPFKIDVREHLDDGTNRGIYTALQGGDIDKMAVGLEPGKAYVRGYEIESVATIFVDVLKAREFSQANNNISNAFYGAYIVVDNIYNIPSIANFPVVSLRDTATVSPGSSAGAEIGTARVRYTELNSGIAGSGTETYRVYLFDIIMNASEVFSDVRQIYIAGSPAFTADAVLNAANECVLVAASSNTSVFELPQRAIKTVRDATNSVDTTYSVRKEFSGATDGSGNITINAGSGNVFESYSPDDFILSITSGGSTGDVIDLTGKVTLGGSPFGTTATFALTGTYASVSVKILATLTKTVAQEKSKTLLTGSKQVTSPTSEMLLDKCDIFRILGIYDSGNPAVNATSSDANITSRYGLDNGQRDNHYDVGSVYLLPGQASPSGRVLIEFEYFSHGAGDYFSVDSYTGEIDYADILVYTSSTGQTYQLRDCLDFRPRKDDTGANFTGTGASTIEFVKFNSNIRADFQYYLNRIDKLYVDEKGTFGVVKGVSEIRPKPPLDYPNSMSLYELYIPAYTFDIRDVKAKFIDNKRYTMRDIGSLEKRIDQVEYYTTLSLLEKETADLQIFDNTGLDRFKNGFIVDNFTSHGIGDVLDNDYRCAVDPEQGHLRPQFFQDNLDIVFSASSSSNYQKTGDLITLPYTDVAFIDQPFASRRLNVNPYNVFAFNGSISLTPQSDSWKDTTRAPDVNILLSDNYDTQKTLIEQSGILGTQWNDWQTAWTGQKTTKNDVYKVTEIERLRRGFGVLTNEEAARVGGGDAPVDGAWRVTETISRTVTSQQVGQTRSGTRTTVKPKTTSQNIGDRVVSIDTIPFIRSREVEFSGKCFKPSTRVYPFFEGIDVSAFCKPTGGSLGQALITNANGEVTGSFTIPNSSTLRFRTGERVFKLSSSPTNGNDADTTGQTTYVASGILETRQSTILSTRTAEIVQEVVTSSRVITNVSTQEKTIDRDRVWIDPLAQSFLITEDGGCFITKIDIFFAKKAAAIPVRLQIRNMVNGYPGQYVIPFSEVVLNPGSVNVSATGATATTFTFPSPVYLQQNQEYCFVLLSDSNDYEVWVGQIGETEIGSNRLISAQPYAGVLFKSQNASTWTADQLQDMKFKMYKANFDTSVSATVVFENDEIAVQNLTTNPFTTTNASPEVRVFHQNHGMTDGSTVTFAGVPAGTYNGVNATALNTSHSISDVEMDYYVITLGGNASASGSIGGEAVTATRNLQMDSMYPIVSEIILPGTTIEYGIKTTSGKSVHGSQLDYIKSSSWETILSNETTDFLTPRMIASTINETNELSGDKSFELRGVFESSNANLSPVIDTQRTSLIVIANRIDSPTISNVADFVDETESEAGSALAKYITKKITLADEAISLKLFLTALLPFDSEIETYYRIQTADSSVALEDKEWVELPPESGYTNDDNLFFEYQYLTGTLEPFSVFQIKVVMKSVNSAATPILKDFRAIALGT